MNKLFNDLFRVKISGCGYHQLCGYPLFVSLLGEDLAIRLIYKAYLSKQYKTTFKLRRGLKIDFYAK